MQGDLPTIDPADIRAALKPLADPAVDIATLAAEITDPAERTNPNVVKVSGAAVAPGRLRATTFTRADAHGPGPHYHHIGLYAYRRAALERFVKLPPSANEQRERLEQLRALDAGMRIDVAVVDSVPLGVDTPEELEKARADARPVDLTRRGLRNGRRRQGGRMRWRKRRSFSRASRARIRISPAAKPIRTTSRCPARPSRIASPRSSNGDVDLGMIPIENSVAGRVADIHHLMPTAEAAHHRRMVPADPQSADGAEGRDA